MGGLGQDKSAVVDRDPGDSSDTTTVAPKTGATPNPPDGAGAAAPPTSVDESPKSAAPEPVPPPSMKKHEEEETRADDGAPGGASSPGPDGYGESHFPPPESPPAGSKPAGDGGDAAKPGGIFTDIEGDPIGDKAPTDIRFTPADGVKVPTDILELTLRVSRDLQVLRSAITRLALPLEHYRRYFDRILGASRACLGGSMPQPEVLRLTLSGLEAQAVDELGPRLKNDYLTKHMIRCAWAGIVLLVLAVVVASLPHWLPEWLVQLLPESPYYYVLLLVGAVVGVSISFAVRNTYISFPQLQNPEADFLRPGVRLAIVCVLTWALGLVFSKAMLNVTVGGLNSAQVLKDGGTSLLVGFLCGFSEQALPTALVQRSNDFFRSQTERS